MLRRTLWLTLLSGMVMSAALRAAPPIRPPSSRLPPRPESPAPRLDPGYQVVVSKATADRWTPPEYLVGVYYFAGWWPEQPNKYYVGDRDWRTLFPGRIATLGEYNTQATMDREIVEAATHAIDFFQVLWYPPASASSADREVYKLNTGLRLFMGSRCRSCLNFTAEYVNHPPFRIADEIAWDAACREWCEAMKHDSYLRVAGRPVFKVHGLRHFLDECGGDHRRVADRLARLRRVAQEMGLPDPLISAGVTAEDIPTGPAAAPYDFLTTYMAMPDRPRRPTLYPYADLIGFAEETWRRFATQSEKPYVPYVPAGWDPRPWNDPRPSFAMPTPGEWRDALQRVKKALDAFPRLGVPTENGQRQKMLLIYAWNEFAEGGIVAPTRSESDMKLLGIKAVFGNRGLTRYTIGQPRAELPAP